MSSLGQDLVRRLLDVRAPAVAPCAPCWCPSPSSHPAQDPSTNKRTEPAYSHGPEVGGGHGGRRLQPNPSSRLGARGAEEVRQHAFFADIDWANLHLLPSRWHQPLLYRDGGSSSDSLSTMTSMSFSLTDAAGTGRTGQIVCARRSGRARRPVGGLEVLRKSPGPATWPFARRGAGGIIMPPQAHLLDDPDRFRDFNLRNVRMLAQLNRALAGMATHVAPLPASLLLANEVRSDCASGGSRVA